MPISCFKIIHFPECQGTTVPLMDFKFVRAPACHGCHGYRFDLGDASGSFVRQPRLGNTVKVCGVQLNSFKLPWIGVMFGRFRSSQCSCRYKPEMAEPGTSESHLDISVPFGVIIISSLLVLLLGVTATATNESGNLLIATDEALHSYMLEQTKDSDHLFFNDVSNKLDDLIQTLSWIAALLNLVNFNEGAGLLLTVPGGLQLVRFVQKMLKAYFHRLRPSGMLTDFSYPSAHTARFAFCASLILLVLLPRLSGKDRATVTMDQWFLIALAAWSIMGSCRMLADAHWLSDTLGGAALGVDIAALVEICVLVSQDSMRRMQNK